MRTANCAARCVVAPDVRADNRPTGMPARCAQTIAAPSRIWNPFDSDPSACITTTPSVSTPSTSNSSSRMREAFSWSAVTSGQDALDFLRAPEVMQVHDTLDVPLFIDHDHGSDLVRFHDPQRLDRQGVAVDRDWSGRHDVSRRQFEDVPPASHLPAEVSIREDTEQARIFGHEARPTEPRARHLVNDALHRRGGATHRYSLPAVHHVRDAHQPTAKLTAGMQRCEVLFA